MRLPSAYRRSAPRSKALPCLPHALWPPSAPSIAVNPRQQLHLCRRRLIFARPNEEYGEIEYGGLPVESSFQYHLVLQRNSPVRFLYSWEVSQQLVSRSVNMRVEPAEPRSPIRLTFPPGELQCDRMRRSEYSGLPAESTFRYHYRAQDDSWLSGWPDKNPSLLSKVDASRRSALTVVRA